MKLTDLWTPDECREALRLMGEICFTEHLWHHRFAVNDSCEVCMFTRCASTDGPETWTVIEGVYATATVQVAAEQVVREGGLWITLGEVTGRFWIQDDVGMAVDSYPTYLAALLAALRAVKETRDGE